MRVSDLYTSCELKAICDELPNPQESKYIVCVLEDDEGISLHIFRVKDCLLAVSGLIVYSSNKDTPIDLNNLKFPPEVSLDMLASLDILNASLRFNQCTSIDSIKSIICQALAQVSPEFSQSEFCKHKIPEQMVPLIKRESGLGFSTLSDKLEVDHKYDDLWEFRNRISELLLRTI